MIIISPSGNLYGSEQVLLEYVNCSSGNKHIYIPKSSVLAGEMRRRKIPFTSFTSLPLLYIKLFVWLVFSQNRLYINEGGHIRYVKILAKLLPLRQFFVHIRLLEDCSPERLNQLSKNIHLITVSDYLKRNMPSTYPAKVIYDPYTLSKQKNDNNKTNSTFTIGIVGRVTKTKGLDALIPILKQLSPEPGNQVTCNFYGAYNPQEPWFKNFKAQLEQIPSILINFKGFVSNKQEIYSNIDLLLHLNKVEALGRILFEAVDYDTPFLTFDRGGCGELTKQLELNDFLVADDKEWPSQFAQKISQIMSGKHCFAKELERAREMIVNNFNAQSYTAALDSYMKHRI